ncbi:MAG TPA: hypothetical protein VK184_21230 [Nostocaceae cyanobacterium]|nr:hypothetical protein [Nostocaceae cyanobacterium]
MRSHIQPFCWECDRTFSHFVWNAITHSAVLWDAIPSVSFANAFLGGWFCWECDRTML